jgi:hypothetical protein
MKWAVIVLIVALLGTNVWWLYSSIDFGVTHTYREQVCREREEALSQSLAIVRLAKGRRVRNEMVEAAHAAMPQGGEPFEKDGQTAVGRLALRFDHDGTFIDISGP